MSAVEELKLLKAQVQDVARVCRAVAAGDLSQKITVPVQGVVMVQLKDVINTMVERLGQFAQEVTRVSLEVGTEGKLGGQAVVVDVEGTWRELTAVVNKLAENLTIQVRSIAEVTMAVARGDLSREIVVEAKGEILELKTTVNNMVCHFFISGSFVCLNISFLLGCPTTGIRIRSHSCITRSRN
jgi:osomolarity two-component system, sensor histidine kinase NIK1